MRPALAIISVVVLAVHGAVFYNQFFARWQEHQAQYFEQAAKLAESEAVRATLQEFEPEALKKRLLGGGARIFESARAWDAFVRDYAERQSAGDEWARQLLERHFPRAYARARLRAKRTTGRDEPS